MDIKIFNIDMIDRPPSHIFCTNIETNIICMKNNLLLGMTKKFVIDNTYIKKFL